MKLGLLAVVILIAPGLSAADSDAKPPWEWTLEERLRELTDPLKATERVRNYKIPLRERGSTPRFATSSVNQGPVDIVHGVIHPELFLPHELFESLVERCLVIEDQEVFRDEHEHELVTLGLPEDFWEQLEETAAPYVADLRGRLALARDTTMTLEQRNERIAGQSPTLCRNRAEGLARTRVHFGPVFDRLLYGTTARMRVVFHDQMTSRHNALWLERGCR